MTDRLISEFQKNNREIVRVSLSELHGHEIISVRVWYMGKDQEYHPARQGLALRVDCLPDLLNAVQGAANALNDENGEAA